jgi:twinkle protein
VVPGELTIVTGLANSGKSEWLDALVVNLAERYGWTFGVCSLENTPVMHSTKLMEKYTRERPVPDGYCGCTAVIPNNRGSPKPKCLPNWTCKPCAA